MKSLLFVDDDKTILNINLRYFRERGYQVYTACTEQEALKYTETLSLDCVILDVMLPGCDGFQLCNILRKRLSIPIIFLTSLTEKEFLYQGFSSGGDDFMTKPYQLKELELRIEARINQHKGSRQRKLLEFGPLVIDADSYRAFAKGVSLPLTSYEFSILLLLASFPEKVFSADVIYRNIWKLPDLENVRTVKVHVARMRRKLEEAIPGNEFIQTVWGKGYQFCPFGGEAKENTTAY